MAEFEPTNAPTASPAAASNGAVAPVPGGPAAARMSRQRNRDTTPEILLRRALHRSGHRYRVAWPVPALRRRTIDVAFTRRKLAVFVDGCFWHGCPTHGTTPLTNGDWWARKIERNRRRDLETASHLRGLGWTVIRLWEHDLVAGGDGIELVLGILEVGS